MTNNYLCEQIETLRKKMISTGLKNGLNSEEILKISYMLDKLMNLYMEIEKKESLKINNDVIVNQIDKD